MINVSEDQILLNDNILENLITLTKSTTSLTISKLYFEIFNMNQNYNQSLDIIFTTLSRLPENENFVVFYYSSYKTFDYYYDYYAPNENIKQINFIYYENGSACYYTNEKIHNITKFLDNTRINIDNTSINIDNYECCI